MRECLSLLRRPNQSPAFLATLPVSASLGTRSKFATTPPMQPPLNPLFCLGDVPRSVQAS